MPLETYNPVPGPPRVAVAYVQHINEKTNSNNNSNNNSNSNVMAILGSPERPVSSKRYSLNANNNNSTTATHSNNTQPPPAVIKVYACEQVPEDHLYVPVNSNTNSPDKVTHNTHSSHNSPQPSHSILKKYSASMDDTQLTTLAVSGSAIKVNHANDHTESETDRLLK